jgi:hypothetical protein
MSSKCNRDSLYVFRPLLAIRGHREHYKEILYVYNNIGLVKGFLPLEVERRQKY